ncbi:MAG: MFS transporter [Acidimicrobiales bacterium]
MGDAGESTGWQPLGTAARRLALIGGRDRQRSHEAFLRLALTHAAVTAGDAMVTVALAGSIFFSTSIDGARGRVLLSLALTMAPFAVVAPFLGPAIDKSRGGRRLMLIVSAVGRALTCLYMARVVHNLLLFLPAALILLILSKAHAVAKSSLVPATVDSPGELVKAGSRLAVLAAIAGFVGAGPAALVLNVFNARWVLRMAALAYGIGAVMAMRTRSAPPSELEPADHVDATVRSRGVSLASVAMAAIRGISGFLTFAVAFSFRRAHAPTWWYGLVLAGGVVGGFVGNLVGPFLRARLREEHILTVALATTGVTGLFVAFVGGRLLIVLVAFAVGLADGIGQLAFDAIVQRDGSEGSRGRSFARFEATFQVTWVAAAVLPVALPIPTGVAALLVGLAASAFAFNYILGRYVVVRTAAHEVGRPDAPMLDVDGSGGLGGQRDPLGRGELGGPDGAGPPGALDAAGRVGAPRGVDGAGAGAGAGPPARWDPGIRWSEAEPAPIRHGQPPPPPPPGPRRNPKRSR